MKKPFAIILLMISLLLSCKKGNVETPLDENPLKGKLKLMKVRDTSVGLDTTVHYTFQYDEKANLQKLFYNGDMLYEWIYTDSENLMVRYYDDANPAKDYIIRVKGDIIKSISTDDEIIYESDYIGDFLSEAQISSNCFLGIYPIVGGNSDFITSSFLVNEDKYSFDLDFIAYAFPPFSNQDQNIHIECTVLKSEAKSEIPIPMQGLGNMGLWFEGERYVHEHRLLYFLALSGYHIWIHDSRLTEETGFFKFDYEKNSSGQVLQMKYRQEEETLGKFEFEYY